MNINIMLVDDHKMVSEVLSALLDREPDMEVVAITDNGREAISLAREVKPDIIVMDLTMPEMNGLEACRCIMAEAPESRIIVLSMHADRRHVMEALKAGAKGYIQKMSAFKTLVGAIRNIQDNNGYLDPNITGNILKNYMEPLNESGAPHEQSALSSRKREILQLIAEGQNPREVACALDINHKTVEVHRRKIMQKLKLSNVADLIRHLNKSGVPNEQSALSSREREILKLITEGENTKEVAFYLAISPKTVESHRLNIMQKLKLSNVAELTRYAIREGIISL
jgi:DNA-binding NarL/FixJ family response regulator